VFAPRLHPSCIAPRSFKVHSFALSGLDATGLQTSRFSTPMGLPPRGLADLVLAFVPLLHCNPFGRPANIKAWGTAFEFLKSTHVQSANVIGQCLLMRPPSTCKSTQISFSSYPVYYF
jgi:hypothetical protein